ncbi:MAG: Rrf2 family transcriptional regulator [Candidatus Omnitrophota bacterium]
MNSGLISRKTDYSIRAVAFMAKHEGEVVNVSTLVAELNMPRPFLRKILQTLESKGILKSQRGKGGGFELARPAAEISLTDMIEAFQGTVTIKECLFRKGICPNRKTCRLKKRLDAIEGHVISELARITVKDLL